MPFRLFEMVVLSRTKMFHAPLAIEGNVRQFAEDVYTRTS
jgi:hypothetical protein